MPIPTPSDKETEDDFMSRCMSSEVMMSEFPKKDQRFAVCKSKWDDKGKEESSTEAEDRLTPVLKAFLDKHPELKQLFE